MVLYFPFPMLCEIWSWMFGYPGYWLMCERVKGIHTCILMTREDVNFGLEISLWF